MTTNANHLKIIAIICMTIDHAAVIWDGSIEFRIIGRLTFPIMAFLLTEGYQYTRDKRKYALRLFLFAIISMYPYYLMSGNPWNVMFTLCFGLILLEIKEKFTGDKVMSVILFFIVLVLSLMDVADWWWPGILAIYVAGQFNNKETRAIVTPGVLSVGIFINACVGGAPVLNTIAYCTGILAAIPILVLYNGERGTPKGKYAFYAYYPLHLIGLTMLHTLF